MYELSAGEIIIFYGKDLVKNNAFPFFIIIEYYKIKKI